MIILKSRDDIARMKEAGQVVARILSILERHTKPGVSTGALNAIAEEQCKHFGAVPVFKNYPHARGGRPFPGIICASVNEEVVHGIPGSRVLQEGDILSIDFGVLYQGFAGDSALTIPVGNVAPEALKLIQVTEECLMRGIGEAKPGNRMGHISNAVQTHAEDNGFSVVRDFVGHGIGKQMHEEPPVPNFGRSDRGPTLKAGMTLAIEPMINAGTYKVFTRPDGWTVVTADGKFSAHFEHTVAITDNGPEILTLR